MINGMYLSTMGAMIQGARHEVIANNLANASTAGFKPSRITFRSIPAESLWKQDNRLEINRILEQTGGGAWVNSTPALFVQGSLSETGNLFDLALEDRGEQANRFFMTRAADGDTVNYTRNGRFVAGSDGLLKTLDGQLVLGPAGSPIAIPSDARLSISANGTIQNLVNDDPRVYEDVGQVGVVRADDPTKLKKLGANRYALHEATMTPDQQGVKSGWIEQSATEPVKEMTSMIEAQRAYEANMSFLRIQDATLGDTVSRLGRIA